MLTRDLVVVLILVIVAVALWVGGRTHPWRQSSVAFVLGILVGWLLHFLV